MVAVSPVFIVSISTLLVLLAKPTRVDATSAINEARYRVVRRYNALCPLVITRPDPHLPPIFSPRHDPRAITGIHLAASGDATSMRISWSSEVWCRPARVEVERAQRVAGANGITTSEIVVEDPYEMVYSMYKSGYFHHALVRGLRERKRYTYRIQCGSYWSDSFSFTTPPVDGDLSPVRVLLIGDHGTRMEGNRTVYSMLDAHNRIPYDMVIHLGDISYANGGYDEYIWDVWADMVEPLAAVLPYMVTPGNHEILLADSGGEVGIPYTKRFSMPMERDGSGSEYWYSWNYGQVHFVSVSSEHAQNISQQQWVETDLMTASERRHVTPWIVMFGHQSIYTSNQRHGNQSVLREWLDPLLLLYDVDILFWGHDHVYERTYPISNSTVYQTDYVDAKAPVHVTCGASGWDLHNCWQPDVMFSAYHNGNTWGYCALHVISPTTSEIQFVNSETNEVTDSFRLTKSRRSPHSDTKQANQNNHEPSGQHTGVATAKDGGNLAVNTLVSPDYETQSATRNVTVDTSGHSQQANRRVKLKDTKHTGLSEDGQTTKQTSLPVEPAYDLETSHVTPTGSSEKDIATRVVLPHFPTNVKQISDPTGGVIATSSSASLLSTDGGDRKRSSTVWGLTAVVWIVVSSLAVVFVANVAFYLWKRRTRVKKKKYELVPLNDILLAGSDIEA